MKPSERRWGNYVAAVLNQELPGNANHTEEKKVTGIFTFDLYGDDLEAQKKDFVGEGKDFVVVATPKDEFKKSLTIAYGVSLEGARTAIAEFIEEWGQSEYELQMYDLREEGRVETIELEVKVMFATLDDEADEDEDDDAAADDFDEDDIAVDDDDDDVIEDIEEEELDN